MGEFSKNGLFFVRLAAVPCGGEVDLAAPTDVKDDREVDTQVVALRCWGWMLGSRTQNYGDGVNWREDWRETGTWY